MLEGLFCCLRGIRVVFREKKNVFATVAKANPVCNLWF